ncbi:MAG: trypsin-like peptidase domain-containing protein [Bacteroidales bacterium]
MRAFFVFLLCSIFLTRAAAQVESPGEPLSRLFTLKAAPAPVELNAVTPKMIADLQETYENQLKPYLFAYPIDTVISLTHTGQWDTVGQYLVCRMTILSNGAESLNLIFGKFRLPEGASVYLYTPGFKIVRGAFTPFNHTPSGQLPTLPLPGQAITVELNLPLNHHFDPEIEITRVSHDFTGVFKLEDDLKRSGSCNVDINCPAGAAWQVEKNAVVKFIRGGYWLCSGALINNTANDGRPLLLTANHCIGLQSHADQSVFFFRYERPVCGSGYASPSQTLSAGTLLATRNTLDFSLVELSSVPPEQYEPYYAGWDRRAVPFHDTVVAIHHPSGDPKKISKSYHRVVTGDFGSGFDSNTHWRIAQWDIGTTEPGSSGCPLFNTDHRIIGDLTGGDASCDYNFNDYFQKFSVSWDRYPDSSNQLRHWLDPQGTGTLILNGYDPYLEGKPLANFEMRPDPAEVGRKLFVSDRSSGLPTAWEWRFEGGIPEWSDQKDPGGVIFQNAGVHQITLKVSNDLGTDSIRQTVLVNERFSYSVSETRIVPGRVIEVADHSTGNPQSVLFTAPGGFPSIWSGPEDYQVSFSKPGDYSITHRVDYPGKTDQLIHYNQVRVLNEKVAFHSIHISNTAADEHSLTRDFGNQGYFPGSNSHGINYFAEEFRNTTGSRCMITGISLPLEVLKNHTGDYYITCYVWNAKWEILTKDSVKLSDWEESSRFTARFNYPVLFDTLVYAGYSIKPWSQATFASKAAVDRGLSGKNTAYVRFGSNWTSVPDVFGLHTSLDLSLEITPMSQNYEDEVKIAGQNHHGDFAIDLGKLVFKQVVVTIYDLMTRQVTSTSSHQGNRVMISFRPPVSAVYIVRIQLDYLVFYRTILAFRD